MLELRRSNAHAGDYTLRYRSGGKPNGIQGKSINRGLRSGRGQHGKPQFCGRVRKASYVGPIKISSKGDNIEGLSIETDDVIVALRLKR